MIKSSFAEGYFPESHKQALVRLKIQKSTLDLLDIKSFRPISNLSFVIKIMERFVTNRFNLYSSLYHLLPVHQSTYGPNHSTETAIAFVHNDIVRAIDNGEVLLLILLDLSSAFDTVDHPILLEVLDEHFSVKNIDRTCQTGGILLRCISNISTDSTYLQRSIGIDDWPTEVRCVHGGH